MRTLGIDTATWKAGVAVTDPGGVVAERSFEVTGSHASSLLPLIGEVLSDAGLQVGDIELVAVSIGPGSFTGLRIGLSTAKGFCLARGVSLVGVPTLQVIATALGPKGGLVCPVLDARKGEVYAAVFRWREGALEEVRAPAAIAPERLVGELAGPCTLVGDGVDAYEQLWRDRLGGEARMVPAASVPPTGSTVARLGNAIVRHRGVDDVDAVEPTYVRRSEAELRRGQTPVGAAKIDSFGGVG